MKEHIKDVIISSISFYVGIIILMVLTYILLGPLMFKWFTKTDNTNNTVKENVIYDKGNQT